MPLTPRHVPVVYEVAVREVEGVAWGRGGGGVGKGCREKGTVKLLFKDESNSYAETTQGISLDKQTVPDSCPPSGVKL